MATERAADGRGTPTHAATSHVGRVRTVNEDAWVAAPPVFVVADGMGGHSGGDVASRIVVEEFGRWEGRTFSPAGARQAVVAALSRAQARLRAYVELRADDARAQYAGTTVVVALLVRAPDGLRWLVVNVGDSRAYAVTPEGVRQVTTDHSVVQELVAAGQLAPEEAASHPERHVITRALSSMDLPEPDFFELDAARAPRLLLCSDGVSGLVAPAVLAEVLATAASPQEAVDALVGAALSSGGTDNATALVVDVVG